MLTEVETRWRRLRRAAAVAAMSLGLAGCGAGYLLQAAHGQWQLLRARTPIARVLAAPDTPAPLRERLRMLQAARAFASATLGLPDNRSYTTYAALGRPYVVWNVVAAPPFSVQPRQWCFPVTGCIAYRGYFRERDARRYAGSLAARGDDTLVAGVAAYSTLGRFADPVLDTMMGRGDADLVGTLFHELAHQLIYLKGDSAFNEAFAMSVERAGVARWLAAQGRSGELAGWLQRQAQQAAITRLFADGRARLATLYAQPMAAAQLREQKAVEFAALAARVRDYEAAQGLRSGYDAWLDEGLNNAHLASVATYFDCVPGFERLLAQHDGELQPYYDAVRALARGPASARRALCAPLPGGPSPAAAAPAAPSSGTG
jgi:predicted aminopeptidase